MTTSDRYPLGFPVVALVTSTGGLDALTQVLAPPPADLPAAVLVVQHLSPDHPSHLAQDHATSAHYGMPGAAIDTNLVHRVLALTDIAPAILTHQP